MFYLASVHRVVVFFMSSSCFLCSDDLFHVYRFSRRKRATFNSDVNDDFVEDEKREHGLERKTGPLVSGTAYCVSSCSMILLNKVVLSSYGFNAGISLMFYQVLY